MTEKPKTYLEEREKIEVENEDRINRFADYQKQRATSHGKNLPAPIVKDKDGKLYWCNRKERRRQERMKNAKRNRIPEKAKESENGQKAEETKEITS